MSQQNELTRNAAIRARRKELENFQRAVDIQWLNNRMDDGRMGRCLALIKKEAEMEKNFQERTDHAAIVNSRAQKEAALASEVAKVRHDEAIELQRRHYLREHDPGLQTLMKKLQAGYVCRDLRQQILHNEYKRLQDKAEDLHANQTLQASLDLDKRATEKEEAHKIQLTTAYRKELQQQLVNRQQQRQCLYEDALIEQKMLDEVMRTIADEDQRDLKQKRESMEKMRKEMVTFAQARDAWRVKQKALIIHEEAELEKQRQAAADRSAAIIAERERQVRIKEEINARISAKIMADEAERQDRDNIIKLLQEQELLEKNVQDDIQKSRKVEYVKMSTKADLTAQMNQKRREREQERMRELEFRKETEAKLAALDAKEHEKERKQKEKAHQYSIDLKRQIENNAKRRESEQRNEDGRAQAMWDYYRDWDAEVSKEREKIVYDHVPQILGYIQAGVLTAGDLPAVRAGAAAGGGAAGGAGGGAEGGAGAGAAGGTGGGAALDLSALTGAGEVRRRPKCNPQCRILREF